MVEDLGVINNWSQYIGLLPQLMHKVTESEQESGRGNDINDQMGTHDR